MAKTKTPTPTPNPTDPPTAPPTDPPAWRVLVSSLGMGTTAARQAAANLDADAQAKIVQIYRDARPDKQARIRQFLLR